MAGGGDDGDGGVVAVVVMGEVVEKAIAVEGARAVSGRIRKKRALYW